ncbi:unnamed protein product, partial [Ixodes persulcatus]
GGLQSYERNLYLTSPLFLKLWRNLRLLPISEAEPSRNVKVMKNVRIECRCAAPLSNTSSVSPRKQVKNQDESLQLIRSASPQESTV